MMAQLDEGSKQKLMRSLERGNLNGVLETYMKYPEIRELQIQRTGDTALHIAVSESDAWESEAVQMVEAAEIDVLKMVNRQGDTALHLAAKFGNTYLCKCIAEKDPAGLIQLKNESGETPLFSAVSRGNTQAFLYLHHFSKKKNCSDLGSCTRDNGDTILHSAISGQFFDLAYIIIKEYPELVPEINNNKLSPLHLLASKPSVFPSGLHLPFIRQLIYNCVRVRRLAKIKDLSEAPNPEQQPVWKGAQSKILKNLKSQTFDFEIQHEATNTRGVIVPRLAKVKYTSKAPNPESQPGWDGTQSNRMKSFKYERYNLENQHEATNTRAGHEEIVQKDEEAAHEQDSVDSMGCIRAILLLLAYGSILAVGYAFLGVWYAFRLLLKWAAYILGYEEYERAKRIKRRCIWSEEVMRELIEIEARNNKEEGKPDINEGSTSSAEVMNKVNIPINPFTVDAGQIPMPKQHVESPDTPLLIAAKNGISEMVSSILEANLGNIGDVNAEEKNVVMLAVEHRHPHLYEYLCDNFGYKKTIFERVDTSGNSLLHLAADLDSGKQFWRIRGAALHMQMEIKWYKYIKKSMPAGFFVRHNNNNETAKDIFQKTHKRLREEGRQWLISTSQSCSVVAALIATVAFATSTTVPGGLNQNTGIPTLIGKPIFILSAASSLIALSSSMISVVMFLSILTSSFKLKDFRTDLPKNLLLGLVTLLMSIVSMCSTFWTGHYFVLKQELNQYAPSIYVLCIPVIVFIINKFPLSFKIIWTTLSKKPRK